MSLTPADNAAREALRARQGRGARYDAADAPAEDLLLARRATAFFARKLNEIDDAGLALPAIGPNGWTRAHVVAAVGYDARHLALALEPLCVAASGLPPETHADALPPLDLAATLPARALRHLFAHAAIHLDVCWRDLPGKGWSERVVDRQGNEIPVRDLPRLRALMLWRHVLALGNGASRRDVPSCLLAGVTDSGDM
ncbi:MAG: maleylpyruvate isomerase N-terminal domain-containing protein [Pararhodobacter sp.]|nr:maleylpyruvate isomerase N-terminal domain-containing protein [Pararhodobacter sp.]